MYLKRLSLFFLLFVLLEWSWGIDESFKFLLLQNGNLKQNFYADILVFTDSN